MTRFRFLQVLVLLLWYLFLSVLWGVVALRLLFILQIPEVGRLDPHPESLRITS